LQEIYFTFDGKKNKEGYLKCTVFVFSFNAENSVEYNSLTINRFGYWSLLIVMSQ